MRLVQQIMGMPITIDIPGCENSEVFNDAYQIVKNIDHNLSNYIPDNEMSKFIRGELDRKDLSPELKEILNACVDAEKYTKGYFSTNASKNFDANGYIKGWAINKVAEYIKSAGHTEFCIGAGGDIYGCGDKKWRVGIQDPNDKTKIKQVIELTNQAIATSGNYERGKHIMNPKTKRTATYWASVSIVGASIMKADVLATACFAMGSKAEDFMSAHPDYRLVAYKS